MSSVPPLRITTRAALGALLIAMLPCAQASAQAPAQPAFNSVRDRIGYTAAQERLGGAMPTGQGIPFAHVEGDAGEYAPQLEGPAFDHVAFSLTSGPSKPSGHANTTARVIYGLSGLAPGVEVVHCLTTNDFLGKDFLRADTTAPPLSPRENKTFPQRTFPRVFTHSWIGQPVEEKQAAIVLRRVDYQIDTLDVIMCVGVNNGRESAVPALLGSAYNVIAVGSTNGQSSGGYTTVETAGRCKPDLVAPDGQTSFTTPVVAACAALLLEHTDKLVEQGVKGASRSEVIKAALLGGATKDARWKPAEGKPLDEHQGAGVVNLDRSLRILSDKPLEPGGKLQRLFGWSAAVIPHADALPPHADAEASLRAEASGTPAQNPPVATIGYDLQLPVDSGEVSLTAVWNRRVDGRIAQVTNNDTQQKFAVWLDGAALADIDLRLVALDAEGNPTDTVAQSTSRIDNVELIHLPQLKAGRYRIELLRDPEIDGLPMPWDVVLTWAIDKPEATAPPLQPQ